MRLKPNEIEAIKTAAADVFGPGVVVRLFGSRVRDDLKGGDIDLHFEVDALPDKWKAKSRFEEQLFRNIDPQRVDTIFTIRGQQPAPIEKIAYRDGVVL